MARKKIPEPKKRSPSDTPRAERPDPNASHRRVFTAQEARQQRFLIGQLWIRGVSVPRRIADLLERLPPQQGGLGYRIGAHRVASILNEVRASLLAHDDATLAEEKFRQRERLMQDANNARAEKKWSIAIDAERLIAKIAGTEAPLRVDVNVGLQRDLASVLAELSSEELDLLVEDASQHEKKSRAYDALPAKVIEAESVEVMPTVVKR